MEIREYIYNFLKSRKQIAVSTSDEVHPWICTLWYVIDVDFNIYFYSSLSTIHVQQSLKNPKVAFTVSDSPQSQTGNKEAVQAWGTIERVTDVKKVERFLNEWTDTPEKYNAKETAEGDKAGVFKISPKQLKLMNKELVGDNLGYKFTLEFN